MLRFLIFIIRTEGEEGAMMHYVHIRAKVAYYNKTIPLRRVHKRACVVEASACVCACVSDLGQCVL